MKAFLLTERFRKETKCEFIPYHTEKEIDNTCTAHKSEIPYPFLIIQEVNVAVPDVRPHTIPYTYIINAVFNILQTNTVTRQVLENQQVYM